MPAGSARSAGPRQRQSPGAGVGLGGLGDSLIRAGASAHFRRAVQALLLVALALVAASLAWRLLTPVGPFGAAPPAASRPLAADPALAARAFAAGGAPASTGAAADASGLTLYGVRQGSAAGGSTAILGQASAGQASYAVGDEVAPGITLVSVGAAHVVLSRGGERFRLSLPVAPTSATRLAAPPSPLPAARVPAAAGAMAKVDAAQLVAQTGLRPRLRDGQPDGYTMIPRGSAGQFHRAGLQPGDVLLAINGETLTPERMADIEPLLRSSPSAVITLERGGERITLTLQMESP